MIKIDVKKTGERFSPLSAYLTVDKSLVLERVREIVAGNLRELGDVEKKIYVETQSGPCKIIEVITGTNDVLIMDSFNNFLNLYF